MVATQTRCPSCGAACNEVAGQVAGPGAQAPRQATFAACPACEWADTGTATGRPLGGWVEVTVRRRPRGPVVDRLDVCQACRDKVVAREVETARQVGGVVETRPLGLVPHDARCDECEPYEVA